MTWNMTNVEVTTADAGPLTFDVWDTGSSAAEGPTVVALHGFPQGAQSYARVAEILSARGARVIAPDQRGYSPQARPVGVEHYNQEILAKDVIGLLDAMGLDKVYLVGHDWGANVAWVTAALFPDRVNALTAVSVPHPSAFAEAYKTDPDQKKRSEYIQLFWKEGKAEEVLLDDDARRLKGMLGDVDPKQIDYYAGRLQEPGALTAALSYYRAMNSSNAATPPVTVPTTYVWSDGDTALGPTGAKLCEKYVTGDYKLVTLEGISHWVPELAPEQLADAIADRMS